MFKTDNNKNIYLNRGDAMTIRLTSSNRNFVKGDKIKFSVVKKNDYKTVYLQKEFIIEEGGESVELVFNSEDTKIGPLLINGPVVYWYEIELNESDTIIGYDLNGPKQLILYPEAPQKEEA